MFYSPCLLFFLIIGSDIFCYCHNLKHVCPAKLELNAFLFDLPLTLTCVDINLIEKCIQSIQKPCISCVIFVLWNMSNCTRVIWHILRISCLDVLGNVHAPYAVPWFRGIKKKITFQIHGALVLNPHVCSSRNPNSDKENLSII